MSKCPNCGQENAEESAVCSECGTTLMIPSPKELMARLTGGGHQFAISTLWLKQALADEAGCHPSEIGKLRPLPTEPQSPKEQALDDLGAFEQAQRIYERLIASGRIDLKEALAQLCMDMSKSQQYLNDIPGAVVLFKKACDIYDQMVHREGRLELLPALAEAQLGLVELLALSGNLSEAVA
jgi:tetratricopeptide (TPR) repeat protein